MPSWMRATSSRPIWCTCAGVSERMVLSRTLCSYQAAPPGSAPRPKVSRVFGRYSSAMKVRSLR